MSQKDTSTITTQLSMAQQPAQGAALQPTPTPVVQQAVMAALPAAHAASGTVKASPAADHYEVVVRAPAAHGMLAYLVGPGAEVVLKDIDVSKAVMANEAGNLRISLPNGAEILLLDFMASAHSAAGVHLMTSDGELPTNKLLASLDNEGHASKLAEVQPAEGPLNKIEPSEGIQTVGTPDVSHGGFQVPTVEGNHYGVDNPVLSDVIGPFGLGLTRDAISTEFFPIGQGPSPLVVNLFANPDVFSTHCDTPLTFDTKVNDSNPDGTPFAITSFTQPAHAIVTLNADGTFTYTPTVHFLGADTFTYTITDGEGEQATATVTVNVTDTAPDAINDHYNTLEGTPLTFDTKVNDSDPDSDPFSITGHTNPAHGTVVENANGTFTYTPAAGFHGTDSFTYTITDDCGLSDTATVTIDVTHVNQGLNALPDVYTTHCDTPITFDTKVNDTNPDGTPFSITSFTQPAHAIVTLNANGTFTYTPTVHFLGADTFTYTITDAEGEHATSTVTVNLTDTAPDAVNDTYTTAFNTPITFDTKVNDTDPDGDPFSITAHTNPAHGTVVENANGTFTYTPNAGFSGADSFTYTITDDCGLSDTATVTVNVAAHVNMGLNALPDTYTTHCDTPITFDTKVNDNNPDGTAFSVTSFTQPAHAIVTLNADGTFTYTPTVHFLGADTFTYTITDGEGEHATSTVTVNLTDTAPDAVNDTYTTAFNTPITFDTKVNDTDPDGDTFSITGHTNPAHGTVVENANGTFTYTPTAGFHGTDTFTYTITDDCGLSDTATVTVNVAAHINLGLNANPDVYSTHCDTPLTFDTKVNDSNPDGTAFSVTGFTQPAHAIVSLNADGTFTYTPTSHFLGADTFTYTITDGEGEHATSTVTVNVTDTAPVAVNDSYATAQNTPITFDTKVNDTDPDGDPFSITAHTNASHGAVVENANGTFTYTPDAGFSGSDSFTYTIADDCGLTSTATVSVVVAAPPPPPPPPPVCPLTIDLGGDGITIIHSADSVATFDFNGDGTREHSAWVGLNEGILVHDDNTNGSVDGINEVFGKSTVDGFTEMAQLEDTNHDGIVNAADTNFDTIKVWTDTNGDGVSQAGELHTLADLGITAINLDAHADAQDFGDAFITATSSVTYTDGHTTNVSDVWYRLDAPVDTSAVLGQQSDIIAPAHADAVAAPTPAAPAEAAPMAASSGAELLQTAGLDEHVVAHA